MYDISNSDILKLNALPYLLDFDLISNVNNFDMIPCKLPVTSLPSISL